ncbi:MAG TPA: DUF3492 domain-containing protein [Chloroflexi bacterium]|nr:DUF3492 domain-containing protein [Chloroflexota bacterium]
MTEKLSVLLCTEGTYPYLGGGVSTWCDTLCKGLPEVDYYIYAITGGTDVTLRYDLPPNVKKLIHIPLWGAEEPAEYVLADVPFSEIYLRKQRTVPEVVEKEFIPLFREFLRGMMKGESSNLEADFKAYGETIYALYRYFQTYDYKLTFKAEPVWELFKEEMLRPYREEQSPPADKPSVFDLTTTLRWLYNFLMPLNIILPEVDIVHSTIASFAGLAGVIAKLERGTPFLLTEHGVFIRERYIAVSTSEFTPFTKSFLMRLFSFIAKLNYIYADRISPVCDFNIRWESLWGGSEDKIVTIYNGVDTDIFVPREKPEKTRDRPTVVAAARVMPIKDIKTMIRAADLVREKIPDVLFLVYGSLTADPDYVKECQALIEDLGLEEHFKLAGFHSNPAEIYNEGDISVLSSLSEGFPYTVLESMSCGRPVVATDVGGVREALEGFGVLVPPRDPQALADGIVQLLEDDELRHRLGRLAREEVLAKFRLSGFIEAYRKLYQELVESARAEE